MAGGDSETPPQGLKPSVYFDLEPGRGSSTAMSDIPRFFSHRSVFITGGTGLMGKVLVEKLLRSCPDVSHIYLLIRPTRTETAQQRLEHLLRGKVFDHVRAGAGGEQVFEKVVAVSGDIVSPNLGVSPDQVRVLCDEVSVVFHSAATVKFNEKLRLSVELNAVGVQRMIALCAQMRKLEAFIHVSTAYANCNLDQVSETIYPPPMEPKKLLDALEWMTDDMVDSITPKIIGDRPNTYTFTKAMGEYILQQEAGSLPVAIVRPSIVGAAWREPLTGWIDNYNGPTGMLAAMGKGLLRTMKGNFNATADFVPVDVPVNLMIATAWYTATHRPQDMMVYNSTSGCVNRLTWGRLERRVFDSWLKNPADDVIRTPGGHFTSSRLWHKLIVFFDHLMPAYLIDCYKRCTGQTSNLRKVYKSMHRTLHSLDFFTTNEWEFSMDNTNNLLHRLSDHDREMFNFDVRGLDWDEYLEQYCLGTKTYVLKEDLAGLPAARRHLRRVQTIGYIINILLFIAVWRLLIARSNLARKLWYFVTQLSVKLVKSMPWMARS